MIDNPISYVKNTRQTYSKQYETVLTEVQVQFGNEKPAWIPYETLVGMSEERKDFRCCVDELAKELGGKWHHKVITNGRQEHKQIVIEYDHKKTTW